jgi:hypothetical protein
MGDFNFTSINWSNGTFSSIKKENCIEHRLSEILSDTFLYQHVNVQTFQLSNDMAFNILDLIFTTESGSVFAVDPRFVLGNISRGHLVIFFEFVFLKNQVNCSNRNSYKFNY